MGYTPMARSSADSSVGPKGHVHGGVPVDGKVNAALCLSGMLDYVWSLASSMFPVRYAIIPRKQRGVKEPPSSCPVVRSTVEPGCQVAQNRGYGGRRRRGVSAAVLQGRGRRESVGVGAASNVGSTISRDHYPTIPGCAVGRVFAEVLEKRPLPAGVVRARAHVHDPTPEGSAPSCRRWAGRTQFLPPRGRERRGAQG